MCIMYETLTRDDIYQKYRGGAKVQSEDVDTLKKLSSSNRIEFYFQNGELYARSPYL